MRLDNLSAAAEIRSATPESVRAEVQALVRETAEPARVGEGVKAAITRAARCLKLPVNRVKRLWYGEVAIIPGHELQNIRERAALHRRQRERQLDAELAAVRERIAQLELDL